jgi:hypothetical protein
VWTGKVVIVAGGDGTDASGVYGQLRDGAAVNPVTGQWHRIAPAPDGFSFQSASAVWTGKEMLIWRSAEGLSAGGDERVMAYNPGADTWRELPPSGLSVRLGAAVVWTGRGLFVWGGWTRESQASRLPDGALLDPQTGTWTPVAPAPIANRATPAAAITPGGVFVWGGDGPNGEQLADGATFDPASNSWRTLPAGPMAPTNNPHAAWTGHEVFVAGQHVDVAASVVSFSSAAFDLATSTWHAVPAPPGEGDAQTVHMLEFVGWTGTDVLLVQTSTPVVGGVTNVSDDRLDGFTWTPVDSNTGRRSSTTEAKPPGATNSDQARQSCGAVPFTATASSQGAFNVTATGTDCTTALSVAGASKGRNGGAYTFADFSCPQGSPSSTTGMAFWSYRCTSGPAQVLFDEQG